MPEENENPLSSGITNIKIKQKLKMKKIYQYTFALMAAITINTFTQTAFAEDEYINLTYLAPLDGKTGASSETQSLIAQYTSENTSLKVYAKNFMTATLSSAQMLSCLNETAPGTYPYIILTNNDVTNNSGLSAYLDIVNEGEDFIRKIEIIGYTQGGNGYASLITSLSVDGTNYLDNYYVDKASGISIARDIMLLGFGDACYDNIEYGLSSYEIPETAKKGAEEINNLPQRTKSIRINWSSGEFAGMVTVRGDAPQIAAIRVYMEKSITTNIASDTQESLNVTLNGSTINVSEDADISVYNLAGNVVANISNAQQIDLTGQAKGLYIVKAKANKSGQAVVKKISLTF